MAKNQTQPSPAPAPSNVTPMPTAAKPPEGLSKVGTDVTAFWDPTKGPIYGKLIGAKDFMKSQIVEGEVVKRRQRIYTFELVADCPVKAKLENGEVVDEVEKPGALVGVWGSAGLNDLDMLGGALVWVNRGNKKKLGGLRSMWTFDIRAKGKGDALRVRQTNDSAPASPDSDDDSIPF